MTFGVIHCQDDIAGLVDIIESGTVGPLALFVDITHHFPA